MNQNQEDKPPVTSSQQDQSSEIQKSSTSAREKEKPRFTLTDAYTLDFNENDNRIAHFNSSEDS